MLSFECQLEYTTQYQQKDHWECILFYDINVRECNVLFYPHVREYIVHNHLHTTWFIMVCYPNTRENIVRFYLQYSEFTESYYP